MKTDCQSADNVPQADVPDVYGLVLMGGRSTRMGTDKSALVYHGKPQREHLTDLLTPLCKRVCWSVNETQFARLAYSEKLLDNYPETGPLGGLLTAFDTYPNVAWLVVPCDLPDLDSGTLQTLLANRNADKPATAFWDVDHAGPEPLVSLWEPSAGPLLHSWFQSGNRSPRRFLSTHAITCIDLPDAHAFGNVNDWDEYEKRSSRQ
ncbi:molybdenum cofactor guanylyltransferase [Fibrella forsythiae]|uniref:Probable molybdenum cofactor guanylyltransferase n=1 Tax=Fibrella forsythiae TaxID=2817061 RepID=A0ABS3JLX9_9BACT|nr:molybdenum cofactor guanylyltransferase [Fibrella forsythiae]MBO0951004.1 molybdenum cofactor guanylyltransferase [Fibrella forsythiae]